MKYACTAVESLLRCKIQTKDKNILLIVEDHGIGIAKSAREIIFDRFERSINSNEVSGLGLGLFITRQIVVAHGGSIWVESELGEGSRFIVELPRDKVSKNSIEVVNIL